VANDIMNIEAVRFNLKTPFDRNVVTQFEHQETLLDYGFAHLGIDNQVAIVRQLTRAFFDEEKLSQ
jgi:actin-related protein 5